MKMIPPAFPAPIRAVFVERAIWPRLPSAGVDSMETSLGAKGEQRSRGRIWPHGEIWPEYRRLKTEVGSGGSDCGAMEKKGVKYVKCAAAVGCCAAWGRPAHSQPFCSDTAREQFRSQQAVRWFPFIYWGQSGTFDHVPNSDQYLPGLAMARFRLKPIMYMECMLIVRKAMRSLMMRPTGNMPNGWKN